MKSRREISESLGQARETKGVQGRIDSLQGGGGLSRMGNQNGNFKVEGEFWQRRKT